MNNQIVIIYIALTLLVVSLISVALIYAHSCIIDYRYYKKKSIIQQKVINEMRHKVDEAIAQRYRIINAEARLASIREELTECRETINQFDKDTDKIKEKLEVEFDNRYQATIKQEKIITKGHRAELEDLRNEYKDLKKEHDMHLKANNHMAMELMLLKSNKNI